MSDQLVENRETTPEISLETPSVNPANPVEEPPQQEASAEPVASPVENVVEEATVTQASDGDEASADGSTAAGNPVAEAPQAVAEPAEEPAPATAAPADEQAAEPAQADAEPAEQAAEPAQADAKPAEQATEPAQADAEAQETAAAAPSDDGAEAAPAEAGEAASSSEAESAGALSAEMIVLQKALESEETVEGQVIGWNKGGYHVALGKVAAFCPVSQIEIGNPKAPKKYLDKTFPFRVIEIQDGGRRVVVSRAAALKADRESKAAQVKEKLQPGAVLEGRVSSLTDFGAFVNLGGGIEGLVHISEISRRRVEHPKEALKHRQKVKVSVLKVEKDGERISLSMKKLEADPWQGVGERFEPGQEFEGTILRQTDFGLFVEVEPGLEGLIHISRLPLGVTLEDESLAVGQTVKGWIHEVDAKRRRLSLSLREVATNDPWQGIQERYQEGQVVKGTVERLASFGAFIELEPGLTGLLSFSAISSSPNANFRRQFHLGKEVSIKVLSIDRGRRRISLGTESSKAEGSQSDYREYMKNQKQQKGSGLNAMAAAFEKLRSRG